MLLSDALAMLDRLLSRTVGSETVSLAEAAGRALAADLVSPINLPPPSPMGRFEGLIDLPEALERVEPGNPVDFLPLELRLR
jgi:molybdopterin biosynthesis enzyme